MKTDAQYMQVLETALLCAGQPLSLNELAQMFPEAHPGKEKLRHLLALLQLDWQGKGLELVQLAEGWRFRSRAAMQPYLARLSVQRPARYSRAVLETLAIIAWRQPVTRGDIEEIRGVSVSTSIVRTLEERGWIRVVGNRDAPGRPALFGTTPQFLSDLGLLNLSELPAIDVMQAELQLEERQNTPTDKTIGNLENQ